MRLNVNVGTFIPKPHTPFQWSEQLTTDESYKKLSWLKEQFKRNGNIKLSYHSPFISFLEGIISRGDERVGDLIYNAYQKEHVLMPGLNILKKISGFKSFRKQIGKWKQRYVNLRTRTISYHGIRLILE